MRSLFVPPILACVFLVGCASSDRTVHLRGSELEIGIPRQLDRDSLALGASRDGSKLVLVSGQRLDHWSVIDSSTLKNLGSADLSGPDRQFGFPRFSLDGKAVYIPSEQGLISWNYGHASPPVPDPRKKMAPNESALQFWNYDRTIGFGLPRGTG